MKLPAVTLIAMMAATATYFAVTQKWVKDPLEAEFKQYMAKWGKKYGANELEARFATFKDNHAFVMAENAKGHKYKLAINEFADMTVEEFSAGHFGVQKPEKMWGDVPYLGTHVYSGEALPDSVDWSTKGAVTPIKNQGQCGSCWAFSTTGSMEGAWQIATGKLVSLSEQQLVDCSQKFGNMGCNGGLMDNGFKYAEQNAMCTEDSYPYKAAAGKCQAATCTTGIPKAGVTGFKDVKPQDLDSMASAVAQQPVSIAIEADQRVFQLYHTGVLTGTCGTKLDHGVLAVGYGTMNGTDYWKVKNSWGASWGSEGYILLEKNKNPAGECGIKMQPSYPVVSGKPASPLEGTLQMRLQAMQTSHPAKVASPLEGTVQMRLEEMHMSHPAKVASPLEGTVQMRLEEMQTSHPVKAASPLEGTVQMRLEGTISI